MAKFFTKMIWERPAVQVFAADSTASAVTGEPVITMTMSIKINAPGNRFLPGERRPAARWSGGGAEKEPSILNVTATG
jgi:hypothetical protein